MSVPVLSVVVPNYKRPDLLLRCLESLRKDSDGPALTREVIVVDDGSRDDSCRLVRERFPEFRLVELSRNSGYPAAVNAGVRASSGEWVLTLNNDTVLERGALQAMLDVARSRSDVGSVAAQQRFLGRPETICSAGVFVDRRGQAADRLLGHPLSDSESQPVEVFAASGAAALYRRAMLDQLDGFDERFQFGLEDVDLAWRGHMRGWRCLYVPTAVVYHDLGATVPHGSELRFRQAGRNRILLIAKNMTTRQLLMYAPSIVAFDLLYVSYALVCLHETSPLRGRWEGMRQWRAMRRSGAAGRGPVPLAPATSFRDVLRRWRDRQSSVTSCAESLSGPDRQVEWR
jgi:GT2 family glycosyltransferase